MMRTPFDATPASATIIFIHTDDSVPAPLPVMQIEKSPQQDRHSCTNVYYIHFFTVFILLSVYADK
jgi:hypothetical protein